MRQTSRGLLQRQARIQRGAGEVLRRRRQRAQAPLRFRLGFVPALIQARAFGAHDLQHGALSRREVVRVLARQVAGGVFAGVLLQAEPLVERRRGETLRWFDRGANVRRPGLSAIHAAAPGVLKARMARFSKRAGRAIRRS